MNKAESHEPAMGNPYVRKQEETTGRQGFFSMFKRTDYETRAYSNFDNVKF